MANVPQLALRSFQLFMALLVLALMGNVLAMTAHDPAINNYVVFVAAFGMLSLFALWPMALGLFELPGVAVFGLDVLNVIFWFCAAVALAAKLGVHSCNNNGYTASNSIMNTASNRASACREAQASTAFLWFGFAAFVASNVLSAFGLKNGGVSGGIRRGGPAMSQRSTA